MVGFLLLSAISIGQARCTDKLSTLQVRRLHAIHCRSKSVSLGKVLLPDLVLTTERTCSLRACWNRAENLTPTTVAWPAHPPACESYLLWVGSLVVCCAQVYCRHLSRKDCAATCCDRTPEDQGTELRHRRGQGANLLSVARGEAVFSQSWFEDIPVAFAHYRCFSPPS